MESQIHQTDLEAMQADHQALAERVERQVEEKMAAAVEKRREYVDHVIDRMRAADLQPTPGAAPDEEATRVLLAAARAAADVRVASRARALRTLTKARERARQVDLQTEQVAARLAELEERRAHLEREREQILETPRAEADRIMAAAAATEARAAETEQEANEILAKATAEADRLMAITDAGRREQVEREANEILAKATAESDRLLVAAAVAEDRGAKIEREANALLAEARAEAAALEQERREQVEREAQEILARAHAEADRALSAANAERSQVRDLLTGALSSLDTSASLDTAGPTGTAVASSSTDLVGDLSSRLQETVTDPTAA